jgi:hypothetical protein
MIMLIALPLTLAIITGTGIIAMKCFNQYQKIKEAN